MRDMSSQRSLPCLSIGKLQRNHSPSLDSNSIGASSSATTPVIPKASFAQHRQLKAAVRRTREIVSAEEVISVIIPPEGTSCEDVACTLSRVDDRLDRISPQFVLDSVTTRESVPGNDHVSENKTVLLAAVRRASELRIRNDSSATYISNLFRTCVGDLDMYEEHEVLRWLQMSDAISNFDLRLANSFVAIASDESHYFKRLAQDQGLPLPPDCDTPFPPIQLIIEDGNLAVVRQLDRSRYTEKDLLGRQGIHIAAVSNKLEILRHLLQTDHDRSTINSRDGRGRTPFFLAALHGNEDIVKALIDAKAAVHDRDNEGHTILEAAASGGHLGIVDQLLKAGAKVNEQLMWKASTPLQAAVRGGHKHTAMFLLQKKADLAVARGYDGKRAVELAQQGGYEEIVALLKEYEATLVGEVAPSEVLFQQGLRSPFHYQLPTTAQEPNGDVDWLRVTRDGDYTVEF